MFYVFHFDNTNPDREQSKPKTVYTFYALLNSGTMEKEVCVNQRRKYKDWSFQKLGETVSGFVNGPVTICLTRVNYSIVSRTLLNR